MRKFLVTAAALAIGVGLAVINVPSQAQPYGPGYGMGYGMMGGYGPGMMGGYGQGGGYGPGMMGGYGQGGGYGHGMMGGYGRGGGYGPGMMYGYGPGGSSLRTPSPGIILRIAKPPGFSRCFGTAEYFRTRDACCLPGARPPAKTASR